MIPNPSPCPPQLFVDNPVGAGWSFTQDVRGFAKNEDDVARNLYRMLEQFYTVFEEEKAVDLYIAGESYGGHYVSAIGDKVVVENGRKVGSEFKMPLKGVMIGDGSIEPLIQFTGMGDLWFRMGLASMEEKAVVEHRFEREFVAAVERREFTKAFHIFDELLNGDFYTYGTYFQNITGLPNYFNVLQPNYPANPYQTYLNEPSTRAAIHVGATAYWDYNSTVEYHLIPDWMTSVAPRLANIANHHIKCLIYTGQLDIILGSAGNEAFLQRFQWDYAQHWRSSHKKLWYPLHSSSPHTSPPLGYARSYLFFHQVVVRNAGHLLALDQPAPALDMITRFINNIPF